MAANTAPIYTKQGAIQWNSAVTTANTTKDGTSGTLYTVFTADATEGSFLRLLRFRAKGTNTASVARIFINNGSSTGTATNNSLYDEVTLPATTNIETAALSPAEVPMNIALPPNYVVFVTLGTTVAGGYAVTGVGGKY